jgi:hypothetical protein
MRMNDLSLSSARWLPFEAGWPVEGYLDDIDAGTLRQTPVYALADLVDVPCLVLLGQASMGKSHAAHVAVEALLARGERADLLSLGRDPDPEAADCPDLPWLERALRTNLWPAFQRTVHGLHNRILTCQSHLSCGRIATGNKKIQGAGGQRTCCLQASKASTGYSFSWLQYPARYRHQRRSRCTSTAKLP